MDQEMENPAPVGRCGARKIDHAGRLLSPKHTSCPSKTQKNDLPQWQAHPCVDVLKEHQKCASLSLDVLGALLRHGVDLVAICRRVKNGTLADPPRQASVSYTSDTGFEFSAYRPGLAASMALIFVVRD